MIPPRHSFQRTCRKGSAWIDLLLPIQLQISRDISTNKFIPFPPDQDPEASDPGTKCTGPPDPVPGAPLPAWPMWKLPMAKQPVNHGIPLIPPVYIWLVIEKKNKWDAHPIQNIFKSAQTMTRSIQKSWYLSQLSTRGAICWVSVFPGPTLGSPRWFRWWNPLMLTYPVPYNHISYIIYL